MKKTAQLLFATLILAASGSANSWWGNDGWNCWPAWTPMYWMEEIFDDNDYWGYGPYGYGAPYSGYGYGPYGYPAGSYYGYPGAGYGYPGYRY